MNPKTTVQELIDQLQNIEDKSAQLIFFVENEHYKSRLSIKTFYPGAVAHNPDKENQFENIFAIELDGELIMNPKQ